MLSMREEAKADTHITKIIAMAKRWSSGTDWKEIIRETCNCCFHCLSDTHYPLTPTDFHQTQQLCSSFDTEPLVSDQRLRESSVWMSDAAIGGCVTQSRTSALQYTHTVASTLLCEASPSFSLMPSQAKQAKILPFSNHCSCCNKGEPMQSYPACWSLVWDTEQVRVQNSGHLSHVIISVIEPHGPNTSWRIYHQCNSPIRDGSLALCTPARIRWNLP